MSRLYEAWYFSRLQLCLANLAVTAANGRVLFDRVDLRPLLVAGLGTFVIYSLDDLLDRARDEQRFPHLQAIRAGRTAWLCATLPIATAALAALATHMRRDRLGLLVALAGASLVLSLVSVLRPAWRASARWPLVRASAVSAVWAAVCVGAPSVYAAETLDSRTVLAFVFEWLTMFVIVTLWRDGEHGPSARRLPALVGSSQRDWTATIFVAFCVASTLMAILGVVLRLFPMPSLAVASAPLGTLVMVAVWGRARVERRVYNDLLAIMSIGCAALVLAAYEVS